MNTKWECVERKLKPMDPLEVDGNVLEEVADNMMNSATGVWDHVIGHLLDMMEIPNEH